MQTSFKKPLWKYPRYKDHYFTLYFGSKINNLRHRILINYLLVNLAVADIVYSAFFLPKAILSQTSTHPEGTTGKVLCTLLTDGNFSWVGTGSSVFTLVAIAMERYFAVVYPHGNNGKLTMRKLKVCFTGRRDRLHGQFQSV